MCNWGKALALVWLLLIWPVQAIELVKVATIPKGQIQSDEGLPVGDTDHDGLRELYFGQSLPPFSTNIWEHWGSNSYQPVAIRDGCHPTAVGDPDQDGLSDLLCQFNFWAFLLESRTPDIFPSETVWEEPLGGFPGIRGYFVDADQDSKQEMWIVPNNPKQIEVWENRGDNTYVRVALLTDHLMFPGSLAFGDFDGDGRTEIVAGGSDVFLHVWENTGDGTYALVWIFNFVDVFNLFVTGGRDLDGDRKPEFIVSGQTSTFEHVVFIYEASGDKTYESVWEVRGEGVLIPIYVVVGDVDGDGVEEFAVATPGVIQLYKAFGDNDFRLIGEVPYSDDLAIALADLNGNGVAELILNGAEDRHGDPSQIHIYELAELQPPVLIPAWFPLMYRVLPGLPVPVHLELFNRTAEEQRVDAWVEVYRGSGEGGPKGPFLRQERLLTQEPLPPQTTLSRQVVLRLPRRLGLYTLQLKVGMFPAQVVDTRWFTVSVGLRPLWGRAGGSERE